MANYVVTSAKPLSDKQKRDIISRLDATERTVAFLVDEALIGGIVISDGDKLLDASVKGKLNAAGRSAADSIANRPLEHIVSSLKEEFSHIEHTGVIQAGVVSSVSDGVIFAEGLSGAKVGELLLVGDDSLAMVMNLEEDDVGAILLTGVGKVGAGAPVRLTDRIVTVPVGEALIGRVVGALGDPIDGAGRIETEFFRRAESPAPGIFDRAKVSEPLCTGVKAVDAIVPIGKGQRELIIGDRQTGKTSLAIDAILAQKHTGVLCVYVAIGQKNSTVSEVIKRLRDSGAMAYTTVVSATASDSPTLQYVAPYTATAMAEELAYQGKDVLIVYDDLSKHAVAYRTISLLLRRPAGREAYPGDVFYVHSRLLERSAKLSKRLGGGSISALPIIETLASDISAYIPTNVISITDGQIFLDTELFRSGVRPAVNVGLSVSRVGGSAQPNAIRSVVKGLKLDLARYRDMAVFTEFGADVDEETKAVLDRGAKLTELLIQPQGAPYTMAEEAAEIYLTSGDKLTNIPKGQVMSALQRVLSYIRSAHPDLLKSIAETGELTEENKAELDVAFTEATRE